MLEKIALQKNLITREQCAEAKAACRTSGNYEISLKEYFISKGMISVRDMKQIVSTFHALKIMRKNALFGTIAVKLGFITSENLQTEIARQKQAASDKALPQFLGDLWLKNGEITKDQFIKILRVQKRSAARPVRSKPGHPAPANGKSPGTGIPSAVPPVKSPVKSPAETVPAAATEPSPAVSAPESPDQKAPSPVEVPDPKTANGLNTEDRTREEQAAGSAVRKEVPNGMVLEIDDAGMNAFLYKSDNFNPDTQVDDILEILANNQVISGIVPESRIEGFIKSSGFKRKPFQVAAGREAVTGKDARVEYFFDTDHLKAGGLDEKGNIDFKDRGEIPWVEEGTLLAEKFPMEASAEGVNLMGHILEVVPALDLPLRCKAGALLSQDELKVYAEISGHPRLSWSGNIHVTDTFAVEGDVNYETGHVEYFGNVDVKGSLKAGFRVKGHDVRIRVVDGGEILADGDVTIPGGVNGAKIYSRGNVRAKYIHNAEIFCLGNLTVEKEIVDSKIETSGALLIPNGEIISSRVVSNMGIRARHIGTDKSIPNTITLGVDAFIAHEIKTIQKKISEIERRIEVVREKQETVSRDTRGYHEATTRVAHALDRARDDGRTLSEKLEDPDDKQNKKSVLKSQYQKNRALFARLDKDLNAFFDKIEKNEHRILEMEVEMEQMEDNLDDLQYELVNFTEWQAANPGTPVAVVTGKLTAGTLVKGPHAQKETKDVISNVKIKELLLSNESGGGYEIQVHDNFKRK